MTDTNTTPDPVLVEFDNGIAFVTLNRPEKRNAMNPKLNVRMLEVLDELEADDRCGVLVLRGNQVAMVIVVVGAELAQWRAVNDLPEADKPAVIVDHRAEVQVHFGEVVFLIGDQVGEQRVFAVTMLVMQHDPGAISQRNIGQHIALATADVGFLAFETTAQQQLIFAVADQGDVFDGVVVEQADFG